MRGGWGNFHGQPASGGSSGGSSGGPGGGPSSDSGLLPLSDQDASQELQEKLRAYNQIHFEQTVFQQPEIGLPDIPYVTASDTSTQHRHNIDAMSVSHTHHGVVLESNSNPLMADYSEKETNIDNASLMSWEGAAVNVNSINIGESLFGVSRSGESEPNITASNISSGFNIKKKNSESLSLPNKTKRELSCESNDEGSY